MNVLRVIVRDLTYTPMPEGGEMRVTVSFGSQELTSMWPVRDQDGDVIRLLDQVIPSIREVMLLSGPTGRELRMTMSIGARDFVAGVPVETSDDELKSSFDQLLDRVGQRFTETLRASLADDASTAPTSS